MQFTLRGLFIIVAVCAADAALLATAVNSADTGAAVGTTLLTFLLTQALTIGLAGQLTSRGRHALASWTVLGGLATSALLFCALMFWIANGTE